MFGQVFSVFSILAIFIACLGLTGLATFMIVQRTKEIGIRKVFGASVNRIVYLLAGDYIKIILLANIVALPVAYLVMNRWLSNYPFRIDIQWWMLLLPTLIVMVVALLTISIQTVRAALINPANSLRYE
jgi:putative ABC transport system permease protein